MNDGPKKFHTGYLVEGLELLIRKVAYTKYDETWLVPWSNYTISPLSLAVYISQEINIHPENRCFTEFLENLPRHISDLSTSAVQHCS
jgi:hypothetical protein